MDLLAVLLFAFVSTLTPGPNNLMVMTSGLNFGVRRTLPHLLGICLGFPAMVMAVGLGAGQVFELWPQLHMLLKIAGVLYLLYLSYRIATTKALNTADSSKTGVKSKPFSFLQAAAFQWVNPKAWVMAMGAMASFTTLDGDAVWQALVITLCFFVVAFPCVGTWVLLGHGARRLLHRPSYLRAFNCSMALLLVLSLLPVIKNMLSTVAL